MSNNNRSPNRPVPPATRPLPLVGPMGTPAALAEPDAPVVTAMGSIEPEVGRSHVPVDFATRSGGRAGLFAAVVMIGLAVVLLLGLWSRRRAEGALANDLKKQAEQPLPIDVVRVRRGSAESRLTLPGEARAFYETTIFARTSGYVDKWFVDIGDPVKQGQVLATIETPELDAQLTAAKAKLDALKSEVHVAETTANFAAVSYRRWEAAFSGGSADPKQASVPGGAVSEQERDQKKSEMEESNAKLQASKAQVALGEADVQRLTTMTGFKQVLAPFDGVITRRMVDIGALVTAGSTTNTSPLYTIAQSDRIRVFVDVPQSAAADVKVGMTATAESPGAGGGKFTGKVDRTASSVDPVSRTLKVEVLVPNPKLELAPGTFLRVTFETTRSSPPVRVPASGINFKPSGPQVAVVGPDGRVAFHDITIDRDMGDYVEIGSGVSDGDAVALNIGNEVSDGEHVDAHEVELAAPPAGSEPAPVRRAPATAAATVPATAPTRAAAALSP